jgi:hypothetical protein
MTSRNQLGITAHDYYFSTELKEKITMSDNSQRTSSNVIVK